MKTFALRSAVVVTIVAFTPPASADPPLTAVLSVHLTALHSNSGQIGCTLYNSEKGFPKEPNLALQQKWCSIEKNASTCAFDPIPAGTYAIACFHDENKNGKLDTGMFGIPKEGIVASNQAKGFMGPPSFKDAAFKLTGKAMELTLKMGY